MTQRVRDVCKLEPVHVCGDYERVKYCELYNRVIEEIGNKEANLPQAQWDREKLAEKLFYQYQPLIHRTINAFDWNLLEDTFKFLWLKDADAIIKAFPDGKNVDNKFIDHIKSHLREDQEVICKICGKSAKEICNEKL